MQPTAKPCGALAKRVRLRYPQNGGCFSLPRTTKCLRNGKILLRNVGSNVMPNSISEEDYSRLESLCMLFGIGLVLFETNPDEPDFKIRVRCCAICPICST